MALQLHMLPSHPPTPAPCTAARPMPSPAHLHPPQRHPLSADHHAAAARQLRRAVDQRHMDAAKRQMQRLGLWLGGGGVAHAAPCLGAGAVATLGSSSSTGRHGRGTTAPCCRADACVSCRRGCRRLPEGDAAGGAAACRSEGGAADAAGCSGCCAVLPGAGCCRAMRSDTGDQPGTCRLLTATRAKEVLLVRARALVVVVAEVVG